MDHAAAVLRVDGQVLVINNKTAVEFGLAEQALLTIAWLLEILEVLLIMLHLSLLFLVFGCDDTLMSFFEELLLRIYFVEYHLDVALEAVRVHIEGAEGFQELEHFLDALSNHQGHFCAPCIVELQQVSVTLAPWHYGGKPSFKGVNQSVVDIEDDIQTRTEAFFDEMPWCGWQCLHDTLHSFSWSEHVSNNVGTSQLLSHDTTSAASVFDVF